MRAAPSATTPWCAVVPARRSSADRGSKRKRGVTNTDNSIDLVAMALQLGASFVARGFSGDKTQLVPLIKAAIEHRGAALLDVLSPCVAFNNHEGSTKSFDYVREHNEAVNRLDFITGRTQITVDYAPGSVEIVEQHRSKRHEPHAPARLARMVDDRGSREMSDLPSCLFDAEAEVGLLAVQEESLVHHARAP